MLLIFLWIWFSKHFKHFNQTFRKFQQHIQVSMINLFTYYYWFTCYFVFANKTSGRRELFLLSFLPYEQCQFCDPILLRLYLNMCCLQRQRSQIFLYSFLLCFVRSFSLKRESFKIMSTVKFVSNVWTITVLYTIDFCSLSTCLPFISVMLSTRTTTN